MEDVEIKGIIYDIQGFSVHDGPGIRTTVFLKGCPLRCMWCHSPESQSYNPQILFMDMKCVGVEKCGLCIDACPEKAISQGVTTVSLTDGLPLTHIKLNREKCSDCGKCAVCCAAKALYLCGKSYTINEVMTRIQKDLPFFRSSENGGVTISGGEALSQPKFTEELLKRCKNCGIHTALDTTGFSPYETLQRILPYVDLFLYDIKCIDAITHEKVTGVSNKLILENARRLAADGAHFQFRIPIIPGINNTEKDILAIGEFLRSLNGAQVEMVQLLPYHKFGSVKYERFQSICPMQEDVEPPGEIEMAAYTAILRNMDFQVSIH